MKVVAATLSMIFDVDAPDMLLTELYQEAEERLAAEADRLGYLRLGRPRIGAIPGPARSGATCALPRRTNQPTPFLKEETSGSNRPNSCH